ncbi:MAG: hypothetical protein NZ772_04440 [Cyanobacteria bacterium]|nr:hypothetical protein [Cyanobacteriota bacterium]MDW8199718.1 hypothetical protein [Cyanobacteriota bacterium SKYGB_h_bin112]
MQSSTLTYGSQLLQQQEVTGSPVKLSTQPVQSELPVSLFHSGQLLAIHPKSRGGLILQRSFYADLIGPGSAVGGYFDVTCKSVYLLGDLKFYVPETYEERRQSVQKRISCIKKQQSIVLVPTAIERAEMIIDLLCRWLGRAEAQNIPHELMSQLAGVLPKTTSLAWQRYLATSGLRA